MRKLWRVVFLVAGFLLLLYGLYESYWWFYKWAPAAHVGSSMVPEPLPTRALARSSERNPSGHMAP